MQAFKFRLIYCSLLAGFTCCNNAGSPLAQVNNKDTCTYKNDVVTRRSFLTDTATVDFYRLLRLIESKGEFSRYNRKKELDSSTARQVVLRKQLCPKKEFDSPMAYTILDDVFSIRYGFHAQKSLKGNKGFNQGFSVTQINFKTAAAKDSALALIKSIGWGDPLKKWNDYYLSSGKTRIYVLSSDFAFFSDITARYSKLVQTQWADK